MPGQHPSADSLVSRFALLFGGQIAYGAILLLNNVLISRWFGPELKGQLALAVFAPYFAVYLANLGFPSGTSYFVSRKEIDFRVAAGATIVFCFFVSLILILLAALAFPGVCRWLYNGISPRVVIVSIAALPALLTVFCFEPLWVAGNLTRSAVIVRLIQGIGYFGAAVVLVGVLKWGLIGAVLAFAIGAWLSFFSVIVIVTLSGGGFPLFSLEPVMRSLRFGFKAHPGTVAEYALYRGDTYLVGYLGGFRALGYYSFAQPLAELMWVLSISVRPILYAETSRSDAERATRLAAAAVRFTLLLGSALAVGIFVFGVLLTHFVLPLFSPAVPVLAILLVATLSATVFQLILADLTSRGRGGTASRVSLIVFPFAVLAYLALVPALGAIGAALGSLIAYSSQSALALRAYGKYTGMPIRQVFHFGRDDLDFMKRTIGRILRRG